jgi:hypothetical protein
MGYVYHKGLEIILAAAHLVNTVEAPLETLERTVVTSEEEQPAWLTTWLLQSHIQGYSVVPQAEAGLLVCFCTSHILAMLGNTDCDS